MRVHDLVEGAAAPGRLPRPRGAHRPAAWAEPHSRFTLLFERLAIDVLSETDISGACRILRISWDEAWHLMERAVLRGQARKARAIPKLIGVDEKAVRQGHNYPTLVCDLERSTVEHIADDRETSSLDSYFDQFTPAELTSVKAVATDMWEPYLSSIRTHLPKADEKIVFDRVHIMRHMLDAVDTVRKREHRALRAGGLDTLTGSKYLWLYSAENLPARHREQLQALRSLNLKTARAWAIKESLRVLCDYHRRGSSSSTADTSNAPPHLHRALQRPTARPSTPTPPAQRTHRPRRPRTPQPTRHPRRTHPRIPRTATA